MAIKEVPLRNDEAIILFTQAHKDKTESTAVGLVVNSIYKPGEPISAHLQLAITTLCIHHTKCEDLMSALIDRIKEHGLHLEVLQGLAQEWIEEVKH